MLKVLAIFAFSLALIAYPQVVRNGKTQHNSTQNESGHSPTCIGCIQVQPASPEQKKKADHEPYQWREFGAPANVINIVLAGAAIFAGGMALRTLKAINRQVDEMARQRRNAIRRERARLSIYLPNSSKTMTIRTDTDKLGEIGIRVQNLGTTPALQLYFMYEAFACNLADAPPAEDYEWSPITSMIEGGEDYPVPVQIVPRFNGEIPKNPFSVFIRVAIYYGNIFHKRERVACFLVRRQFVPKDYGMAVSEDRWMIWGGARENYEYSSPQT